MTEGMTASSQLQVHYQDIWMEPHIFLRRKGGQLSERFRSLLACTGSLTQRMEHFCGRSSLHVRLEKSLPVSWPDTLWSQAFHLSNCDHNALLFRDAWLMVNEKKCLFAHSQIDLEGLPSLLRQAIESGRKPLGALFLARDNYLERRHLELTQARIPWLATRLGLAPSHLFWCRRSLLSVSPGNSARGRILELFWSDLSA